MAKHSKHPNTLYVGSEIKGKSKKVTNQQIEGNTWLKMATRNF